MTINPNYVLTILAVVLSLSLSACSGTTKSSPVSHSKYPSHNDKVFITGGSLPADLEFELISTIEVGEIWYGSSTSVLVSMADRARELGANGIIRSKTWKQPSGWSWAAPHGSGQAVRVKDIKALQSLGIKVSWY